MEWIDDLVKDIKYLQEMRRMEEPEYAKHNDVSFHIGMILASRAVGCDNALTARQCPYLA